MSQYLRQIYDRAIPSESDANTDSNNRNLAPEVGNVPKKSAAARKIYPESENFVDEHDEKNEELKTHELKVIAKITISP